MPEDNNRTRRRTKTQKTPSTNWIAIARTWYFPCLMLCYNLLIRLQGVSVLSSGCGYPTLATNSAGVYFTCTIKTRVIAGFEYIQWTTTPFCYYLENATNDYEPLNLTEYLK